MWTMAWRNLWRNRGRTVIMLSAISLSSALAFLMLGIMANQYAKSEASALQTAGGSVLVHGDGYWEEQTHDICVDHPARVVEALRSDPRVTDVTPRVLISGLINSSRYSAGLQVRGVDPDLEAHTYDFRPYVVEGRLPTGAEERDEIALGYRIVEDLEVELGDRLVLTTTDIDGEMTRALFHLGGIINTGIRPMDSGLGFTSLDAAQRAINAGEAVTQVGANIVVDDDRHAVADAIRASLADSDLEVLTWDDAYPEMIGYIKMDRSFGYFYLGVIFLVVAFGIANTFLMAVLERIRELGLLAALGMSGGRIARLVLTENLLMTMMGITLGYVFGFALHAYVNAAAFDMAVMYGDGAELAGVAMTDTILASTIDPARWIVAGVVFSAVSMLSAIYPAWRSSRLDPVEAMRTFQ